MAGRFVHPATLAPHPPLIVEVGGSLPWAFLDLPDLTPAAAAMENGWKRPIQMPGGVSASLSNITIGASGISFSAPGFYYFSVRPCTLKVLCVDPCSTQRDFVLAVAGFMSSCTMHSLTDFHKVRPDPARTEYNFSWATRRLFRSNIPLGYNCGDIAAHLGWALNQYMGLATRQVTFPGHVLMEVTLSDASRICIDGDFGVAILNSAEEIVADYANGYANMVLNPFQAKKDVPAYFNGMATYRDDFAWIATDVSANDIYSEAAYRALFAANATTGLTRDEYVCNADGRCMTAGTPVLVPV